MSVIRVSESDKAQEIALEFESKGYTVFIGPSSENIPFKLHNYQPDLIAIKDNGGVVVEVKASLKRLPVQKFHEIAQQVSSHQGWKFALVTLDDPVSKVISIAETDLPDPNVLKENLKDITTLVAMGMLSIALISLWIQIESWLRIKARLADLPLDLLQPQRLINHLYSDGELSMSQTDQLKELMQLRNKVVHGFDANFAEKQLEDGMVLLHEIISSVESMG
ncbi:hypothetical protein IQ266_12830 [filamentous cyanobacterium LEGE 11480]|uniref:REase AHJR-like domain-containing protein n=1 Tax=Romeriopsis navalis LEGE 11480 TaxID=2777977 RepID=A0A928Z2Q1_9CYAN|nr:hypothetical protein [Romeriopsis navalis]MBE9030616.1 hypothetical protein [Romeriopsis navalis LEGE 11480]